MKKLLLCLSIFFFPPVFAKLKPGFQLDSQLKGKYLTLLNQAADFHKAMEEGDKKAVQMKIKETQEIIARLYSQILSISHFHHRIHSHKLLKSMEEQLSIIHSNNSENEKREKKSVKKLFNSFFELAQVYGLSKDIEDKIFYCSRDRSLWFQKNGKAKNPISPLYKACGRQIL